MKYVSLVPGETVKGKCSLVITTRKEIDVMGGHTVAIEDLDENPAIMKGQVLAKMALKDDRRLLFGVDPGSRIGVAMFYSDEKLVSLTLDSVSGVVRVIENATNKIPASSVMVKIGDGEPKFANLIAHSVSKKVTSAIIEIVDEKGTSTGKPKSKGLTRDQKAAERIAFRKGEVIA